MYSTDVGEGKSIVFTDNSLKHLEIKDSVKFKKELEEFLSDLKPQEALLLLSDEVTFQDSIPISEDYKQKKEEFFEKIPFPKKNVARKELKTDKEIYFFSANQEAYKTIVEVCTNKGWTIDHVVPLAIFPSLLQKNTLTIEEVEEVLQSQEVLEKTNLIDGEEYVVEEVDQDDEISGKLSEESEKPEPHLVRILFGLVAVLLLGSLAFGAYQFRQGFKQQNKTDAQKIIETAVQSPSPESSAVALVSVKKEDLKIQVLNGSGVAGQAGSIKERLESLSFGNISTGNSPFDNKSETVASYSARVSEKDKDEIKGVLELNFGKILSGNENSGTQYDITIITGTQRAN